MLTETICNRWRPFRATNANDNGYPSRVPTATEPVRSGNSAAQATTMAVVDFGSDTVQVQNAVKIKFYGVGSNNDTFSCRFIGWEFVNPGNVALGFWDATDLFEVLVTLTSSITGVSGRTPDQTNLFADTITIVGATANAGVNINVVSPANDRAGYLVVDFLGFRKVEPIFTTGGVATSCNAMYSTL